MSSRQQPNWPCRPYTTDQLRNTVREVIVNDVSWTICLSGMVRGYVQEYLNSDQKFQQALVEHTENVEQQLDVAVRDKIQQIISEDQYHTINTAFFEATERKVQKQVGAAIEQLSDTTERTEQLGRWTKLIGGISLLTVLGLGVIAVKK